MLFLQAGNTERLIAQAQQFRQAGNLPAALAREEQALARDGANGAALAGRALVLATQAQADPRLLPAAITAQELAAQRDPANYAAPLNRAALLAAHGSVPQAEAALQSFIERDTSGWALPSMLLAQLQEASGDPAAPATWQEMLHRQPDLADSAACRRSATCAALPLPAASDAATLRRIQPLLDRRDPAALDELAALAQRRLSVDLWAAAALAASDLGDDHAAQRFLRAAIDQSQMIGGTPTRLLGLALLRDALRRDDRAALASLVARWAAPGDPSLVPQLAALTTGETDRQIAAAALEAAQRLANERLLQQAQTYGRTVQQALVGLPPQQAGRR